MQKLYKYRFFNGFEKIIIENSSLYYAPVESFNDPFDCKLSFKKSYSKNEMRLRFIDMIERTENESLRLKNIVRDYGKNEDFVELFKTKTDQMIDSIGVLSLSQNCNSILMWSHYANNHTGLVFEFSPININAIDSCFYHPLKVQYSEEYEELSYTNNPVTELPKLILTKYKDWAYEEEYRCINLESFGTKKFEKKELTGIIFGAKSSSVNIQNTIDLCQKHNFNHVKFKQAKLHYGSFSLSCEELEL